MQLLFGMSVSFPVADDSFHSHFLICRKCYYGLQLGIVHASQLVLIKVFYRSNSISLSFGNVTMSYSSLFALRPTDSKVFFFFLLRVDF